MKPVKIALLIILLGFTCSGVKYYKTRNELNNLLNDFPEALKEVDSRITGTHIPSATIYITYKLLNPNNYLVQFSLEGEVYFESEFCNSVYAFAVLSPNSVTTITIPIQYVCARGVWEVEAKGVVSTRLFGYFLVEVEKDLLINNTSDT